MSTADIEMPGATSRTQGEGQLGNQRRQRRPRLGFVGLGWIGLNRMQTLVQADLAEVTVVADLNPAARSTAVDIVPSARQVESLAELLDLQSDCDLDGVVIATPSGMHCEQVQQVLQNRLAVFCQKPLARTESETHQIVALAEAADCLLHVDLSYRHVQGLTEARRLVQTAELGKVFLVDLVFHNAYGPDKEWFYDLSRSGGGCVIDLGTHLIDLCGWMLGEREFTDLQYDLWQRGASYLPNRTAGVEDAATLQWRTPTGTRIRLACSWNLHAGTEAIIEAHFYGTEGAVVLRNLNGSFFDLVVERHRGTQRSPLASVDSEWGARALLQWVRELSRANRFDPDLKDVLGIARLIDGVYCR